MALPEAYTKDPSKPRRMGVVLLLYGAAGSQDNIEVQRAPDDGAGAPNELLAKTVGITREQVFVDEIRLVTGAVWYRSRGVRENYDPSDWTCWFKALPADLDRVGWADGWIQPVEPIEQEQVVETATDGELTLLVADPQCRVTGVEMATKSGAAAWSAFTAVADTGASKEARTYVRSVSKSGKHPSAVKYRLSFYDAGGVLRTRENVVTFGILEAATITGISITFDTDNTAVVAATADLDTSNIYVTAQVGSAPSDPTPASNDGQIVGSNGSVDTNVLVGAEQEVFIKARAYDAAGIGGVVVSVSRVRPTVQSLTVEYASDDQGSDSSSTFDPAIHTFMRQSVDGGTTWTDWFKIVGEDGASAEGRYTDYIFRVATTQPATPTGEAPTGWFDSPPAHDPNTGDKLWMSKADRDGVDDTLLTTWSTPVQLTGPLGPDGPQGPEGPQGPQGEQGVQGPAGDDGQTSYFHVAYADSADGSVNFNHTSGTYIGTYVDFVQADSSDPLDYNWQRFEGLQGEQGIPGENGENGETSYLHIKYSNDGGTTFTGNNGEDPGQWIGQYVDFVQLDSSDPADYTWTLLTPAEGGGFPPSGDMTTSSANGLQEVVQLLVTLGAGGSTPIQYRYRVVTPVTPAPAWSAWANVGTGASGQTVNITVLRSGRWDSNLMVELRDGDLRTTVLAQYVVECLRDFLDPATGRIDPDVDVKGGRGIFTKVSPSDPNSADGVPDGTTKTFVTPTYIDGSYRIDRIRRSSIDEVPDNLFKKNTDTLDTVAEGTTYQRVRGTALTGGDVDLGKAGVINKVATNIDDSAGPRFVATTYVDLSRRPHSLFRNSVAEAANNLFKKASDTADSVLPSGTRTFTAPSYVDASFRVTTLRRNTVDEPSTNLFKRGVDAFSDVTGRNASLVAEDASRGFVHPTYTDGSRRPDALIRSGAFEASENLFKRNSDTADVVVASGTRSFVAPSYIDGSFRIDRIRRAAVDELPDNLFKRSVNNYSDIAGSGSVPDGVTIAATTFTGTNATFTGGLGSQFTNGTNFGSIVSGSSVYAKGAGFDFYKQATPTRELFAAIVGNPTDDSIDVSDAHFNIAHSDLRMGGTSVITSARLIQNVTGVNVAGNVDASGFVDGAGGFRVNGTAIVNSSRNLLNITSINCSGGITAAGTVSGAMLTVPNVALIQHLGSNVTSFRGLDTFTIVNGAALNLGAVSSFIGLIVVNDHNQGFAGVYLQTGGGNPQLLGGAGIFDTGPGNANRTNLYTSGGDLFVENLRGASRTYTVIHIGR